MFSECVITVVWIYVPLASQPAANQSRIPHAGLLLSSLVYIACWWTEDFLLVSDKET
jgi:hypothetical protein